MPHLHEHPEPLFDARLFGAVGDGKTLDTAAIQRAIDACTRQGGGVVLLHNGIFLSGSLFLKSHVNLHLSSTATLLGSANIDHYHFDAKFTYCAGRLSHAFIYAEDADSIAITGRGAINGNGAAVVNDRKCRPMLIRLRRCTRVLVRDVRLLDFASWGLHPVECRDIRIEGITIHSHVQSNNDGIDLEGCEQACICNCNIDSGDDSIALKTVDPEWPCRDIVVTNCVLTSACAAIRIGPESKANFERIAVSNCVIRNTGLNGIKLQVSHGAVMRDVVFSNIVMDNVTGPISIRLGGWDPGPQNVIGNLDDAGWEKGGLKNILFMNIRARVAARYVAGALYPGLDLPGTERSCISIMGTPQTRIEGISFNHVSIVFPGGGTKEEAARRDIPELARQYPEMFIFGVLPAYGLFARHADKIALSHVTFELASQDMRPAVVCDDVNDLELTGLTADAPSGGEPLVRLRDTRDAQLARIRARGHAVDLLKVEGPVSKGVVLEPAPARVS